MKETEGSVPAAASSKKSSSLYGLVRVRMLKPANPSAKRLHTVGTKGKAPATQGTSVK